MELGRFAASQTLVKNLVCLTVVDIEQTNDSYKWCDLNNHITIVLLFPEAAAKASMGPAHGGGVVFSQNQCTMWEISVKDGMGCSIVGQ